MTNLCDNLSYLFLAYAAAWGIFAVYLAVLGARQKALSEKLAQREERSE